MFYRTSAVEYLFVDMVPDLRKEVEMDYRVFWQQRPIPGATVFRGGKGSSWVKNVESPDESLQKVKEQIAGDTNQSVDRVHAFFDFGPIESM